MENKARLPSMEEIILAYEDGYENARQVVNIDLLSSTTKIRKMIAEYLVTYRNQDGEIKEELIIGKVYSDSKKGIDSFLFLKYIWENGFNADQQFTAVRPIAYLKQWRLMLMSKSPGKPVDEWMYDSSVNNEQLASLVADWLTRMHAIPLTKVREVPQTRANADVKRFYDDLVKLMPKEQTRLKGLYNQFIKASEKLKTDTEVLLHGDFHTKNVFMHEERVIAIDFDHHFAGDPAWDVAYFSCQIQVSGFFKKGDFTHFQPMVKKFVNRYLDRHPIIHRQSFLERISLYSARSLFESLHYELCVLNTGNYRIVDTFLAKCEQYLEGEGYQ